MNIPRSFPALAPPTLCGAGCRSIEPSLRSNIIIVLGDLALHFPNLLKSGMCVPVRARATHGGRESSLLIERMLRCKTWLPLST